MINTQELEEIIALTLFSGYLQNEAPVSLLIVAEVEGGKSELAKEFSESSGVVFPHDITAYGIQKSYGRRIMQKQIRHIIFPEFVHCLVRTPETVKTLLAFLNGLIAEGVKEIHTFRTNFTLPQPLTCGVIACVTIAEFDTWRKYWEDMGFLSRLLPVTYSYSKRIEREIFDSIFRRNYTKGRPIQVNLPSSERNILLSPRMAKQLKPSAKAVGRPIKIRGFRPQIALQRLAMARALMHGRPTVLQEDINRINELAIRYMNFNYGKI